MRYNELTDNIIGIYKINFPNNKVYIGLSKDVRRRIREHFWGIKETACDLALKKYFNNINDFEIELLETFQQVDYNILSEVEIRWIEYYHSNEKEFGYNLTSGGLPYYSTEGLPWSKFTYKDLEIIYQRLLNGDSNIEIAKDYNVVPETIGQINQGHKYKNDNFDYPLRDNSTRKCTQGLNNHNAPTLDKVCEVCELLKQKKYTYQEIAKLTDMSYTYVANINLGKISYCNELPYTYPIQIKHNGRRNPLNEQEALEIIQLLKENQLTQKEIGAIYGSSYLSISRINNGNLYKQNNENYPIRKGYPRKSK